MQPLVRLTSEKGNTLFWMLLALGCAGISILIMARMERMLQVDWDPFDRPREQAAEDRALLLGAMRLDAAEPIDLQAHEGAVVLVTGLLQGSAKAVDPDYSIAPEGALLLVRQVEVLRASSGSPVQLTEFSVPNPALDDISSPAARRVRRQTKELPGGTVLEWEPSDSGEHPLESRLFWKGELTVANLPVDPAWLARSDAGFRPVPGTELPETASAFSETTGGLVRVGDYLTSGGNAGDRRVSFKQLGGGTLTLLGRVREGRIGPLVSSSGQELGGVLDGEQPLECFLPTDALPNPPPAKPPLRDQFSANPSATIQKQIEEAPVWVVLLVLALAGCLGFGWKGVLSLIRGMARFVG